MRDLCIVCGGCDGRRIRILTEDNKTFCPAHVDVVREVSEISTEIKNLARSHQQVYDGINEVRKLVNGEMNKRLPYWVTFLVTFFASIATAAVTLLLSR